MERPRITILTTNAGGGHMASAWALRDALEPHATVTLLKLMEEHSPFPLNRFSSVYPHVVRTAPLAWRMAFETSQSPARAELIHHTVYRSGAPKMRGPLLGSGPDVVVSVYHFITGTARSILRHAGLDVPFVTVVTDPVTITPLWFYRDVDLCCVAEEEARVDAIRAGIAPERVRVTGLPVRRAFTTGLEGTREDARLALGLEPDVPVVLMVAGGAGMGNLEELAHAVTSRLRAEDIDAQLVLIAGTNETLRRRLEDIAWPLPTTVLGFTSDIASWMRVADVMTTKAGPGTIAEAACIGVPTVLVGFVPGQEEGNLDWARRRFGMPYAKHPPDAAHIIARWLGPSGGSEREGLSRLAREAARPEAAANIADAVLGLAGQPTAPPLPRRSFARLRIPRHASR